MPRTKNSLFGLRRSLSSYHNSQSTSTSMSSSLSSISELSGAASATSHSVTSANGSVARDAVRALVQGWALKSTFFVVGVGAY